MKNSYLAITGAMMVLLIRGALAQTQFTKTDGGDWLDPLNWSAGVPSGNAVTFADGTYTVTSTGNATPGPSTVKVNTSNQDITLDFSGFTLNRSNALIIGDVGTGATLSFIGGTMTATGSSGTLKLASLGVNVGNDNNTLNISGLGTTFNASAFRVASGAGNAVNISSGATVNLAGDYFTLALQLGASNAAADNNTVTVSGSGTTVNAGGTVSLAAAAGAESNGINVQSGGTFNQTAGTLQIGAANSGTTTHNNFVNVTGAGSSYAMSGTGVHIFIGGAAGGVGYGNYLRVADGATFTTSGDAKTITIRNNAASPTSNNRLEIDGGTMTHNGAINNSQQILVQNGGSLTAAGLVTNVGGTGAGIAINGATSVATFNSGLTLSSSNASTITGDGTLRLGGTLTTSTYNFPAIATTLDLLGGTREISVGTTLLTLNGAVKNGGMNKTGTGILVLNSNTSDFAGGLTINAGSVRANTANALGSAAGQTTVNGGAFLVLVAPTLTTYGAGMVNLNGTGDGSGALQIISTDRSLRWSGGINMASTTGIGVVSGSSLFANGQVSGSGAWTKSGDGALLLQSNDNDFSGAVIIAGGTIRANAVNALGTTGAGTTVASGATLQLDAADGTIYAAEPLTINGTGMYTAGALTMNTAKTLSWAGTVNVASDSRIGVASADGRLNITGDISGTGQITKVNPGTLNLTGNNTYAGGTLVSGGLLLVNNTTGSATGSGAVTVASGARLGGSGTIAGPVTLDGVLAPGNSIDTLTVNDDVSWNGTLANAWAFELGEDSAADRLSIGGDFLKGTGSDFAFNFGDTGQFGTFTLVEWEGSTTFSSADFSYTNLGDGLTGEFGFSGSSLVLTVIPEPTTGALFFGAVLAGLALLRRRRV